ncbi:hypothetical protein [Xylanimonas protaetiae]|uniref:Uncharacterized protein n=1 Tax=Xylanimonas protaetiae TaxID=2509457 RepID=A0A4P6F409_9MICO|nr:hypothetical protein [Xylanimonas protaetiae]QAY70005.1 hypothetical protein ET471_08145 [Xylanimonas protaetiae]
MPSYIIKADPDTDLFVEWSTVVEAPTRWGTRAQLEAAGFDADRLDRAATKGSSCRGDIADWYVWGEGFIYQQQGWLPRARLAALVERLGSDEHANVTDLLDPFGDGEG